MATRRSGRVKIRCTLNKRLSKYRCTVKTPEESTSISVGVPPASRLAVDSPQAYDQVAHAALSFVDGEIDVGSFADYTDTGWKICRR